MATLLGYLVLRELPIWRFYARALIMGYFFYRVAHKYQIFDKDLRKLTYRLPEHYLDQYRIFDNVRIGIYEKKE